MVVPQVQFIDRTVDVAVVFRSPKSEASVFMVLTTKSAHKLLVEPPTTVVLILLDKRAQTECATDLRRTRVGDRGVQKEGVRWIPRPLKHLVDPARVCLIHLEIKPKSKHHCFAQDTRWRSRRANGTAQ